MGAHWFEAGAVADEETGMCPDQGGEDVHWRLVPLPSYIALGSLATHLECAMCMHASRTPENVFLLSPHPSLVIVRIDGPLLLGSMYFWSWLIQLNRSYEYIEKIARTGISTLNGHISDFSLLSMLSSLDRWLMKS